jgi:hypothetical protein
LKGIETGSLKYLQPLEAMAEQTLHPVSRAMAGGSHGLLARAYFHAKPFLPLSVRWAVRRIRVPKIMRRSAGVWPIDESAGGRPRDWKGWPDGKQFALVFTHDVESGEGLSKVRNLAELEMDNGFRSSFNFIPEGPYRDPVELREWLEANGFEVGVHDLCHDGHLYESRESFNRNAKSINRYLHNWRSVGFRSGFMLRQLDWLHELDVLYDASTFDTDPFEPQPEGAHTIFPFHVKPPAGLKRPGYVELPYTLPQDSTLFLLLREKTPEIWQHKLDWISRNGGLALVNIHPDYIDFSGSGVSGKSYQSGLISDFMAYIRSNYEGTFWNPLARDLAVWYRGQAMCGGSVPENRETLLHNLVKS